MASAKVKTRISSKAIAALSQKLAGLDKKVARKALRKGIQAGTKAVMWEAKSLVPKRTGALRKSIGRKIWTKKGGAVIAGVIGPRRGFRVMYRGKPIDPVKYAHLVEFGRREVVAGMKKGKPTGKKVLSSGKEGGVIYGKKVRSVAPVRFMSRAWERTERQVVREIIIAMKQAIKAYYARPRFKMKALAA